MLAMNRRTHKNTAHMKKSNRGCPSSDSKNRGVEKALNSWSNRVDEVKLRCLKYGAELDRAMIRAGYSEVSAPEVVATIE